MLKHDEERERQAESKRILKALSQENMDRSGSAFERGIDYFKAADRDSSDAIEVWGTRFGRWIGVVLVIGMFLLLAMVLGVIQL